MDEMLASARRGRRRASRPALAPKCGELAEQLLTAAGGDDKHTHAAPVKGLSATPAALQEVKRKHDSAFLFFVFTSPPAVVSLRVFFFIVNKVALHSQANELKL